MVLCETFDVSQQAALNLVEFKEPRKIKKKAPFILKLGLSLKHLSECLRSIALRESGEVRINKMRNFLELYSAEWYVYSAHAKVTLQKKKCNDS